MMYVPGVSAILSSLLLKGKISSFGWRLGKLKYLGWAYLLPLMVAIIAYGLVWISVPTVLHGCNSGTLIHANWDPWKKREVKD